MLLWEQSLRTALKGLCVVDQSSGGRSLPPIMPNHSALHYTLTQTMRKRNVRQSRIVTLGVLSTEELTAELTTLSGGQTVSAPPAGSARSVLYKRRRARY